jgi:membrane associated rhomboid family serine protease
MSSSDPGNACEDGAAALPRATAIPPDEWSALVRSLVASLGIPLFLVLVLDPLGALLRPLHLWLLLFGLPVWVLARALHRWAYGGDSLVRAFLRDLRPTALDPFVVGDRPLDRIPWLTAGLIAANVAIHHAVADPTDYALRIADPALWPWTNFSALFAHADGEHLWGNMLFLWVFGSAVEPRIGRARTLAYYLLAGSAGNALFVAFHAWAAGHDTVAALGASGAIMGLMGLFVVRCHFTSVGLAIPLFGPLGAGLPLGHRVQVNAMLLAGLYVCLDLLGARSDLAGEPDGIAHMAHLGGYGLGLCLAYATGLAREGHRERLVQLARRPADLDGPGPDREARDRALEHDPANHALRLARARDRSKYVPREDGREDYERVIRSLLLQDRAEAARVFVEFFRRYGAPLAAKEQLVLTPALERLGALDAAARALELVSAAPGTEPGDRERALLHQARLLRAMGHRAAAAWVYEELLREQPTCRVSVEAKLRRCRLDEAVASR